MVWIGGFEVFNLPLQIFFLVCAGDSGIDDAFLFIVVFVCDTDVVLDVDKVVETLPTISKTDAPNNVCICPFTQGC